MQEPVQAPVLTVKNWMLTLLLLMIPIVNIVMLFVWAFGGGTNPNKQNYAKASLLWALIALVLYLIFGVIFASMIASSLSP